MGTAVFSPCMKYRYLLTRQLQVGFFGRGGSVAFLMLNPSTATAFTNDPTISRCIDYAEQWGFRTLYILNLFGFRSTDPTGLRRIDDPVGPENDKWILSTAEGVNQLICAWGNHGAYLDRGDQVRTMLRERGVKAHILGLTKTKQPTHPLFQPRTSKPKRWKKL